MYRYLSCSDILIRIADICYIERDLDVRGGPLTDFLCFGVICARICFRDCLIFFFIITFTFLFKKTLLVS